LILGEKELKIDNMSRYLGREKNKGVDRRNTKALEYFKKLIAKQDEELINKTRERLNKEDDKRI
jgi:hypothetical protein